MLYSTFVNFSDEKPWVPLGIDPCEVASGLETTNMSARFVNAPDGDPFAIFQLQAAIIALSLHASFEPLSGHFLSAYSLAANIALTLIPHFYPHPVPTSLLSGQAHAASMCKVGNWDCQII